ncbi:MAG: BLUF domain-containing protein [Pseudomonadota bacterium]|jgi:hypothetical protein
MPPLRGAEGNCVKTIVYSSVSPAVPDANTVLSILDTARTCNRAHGIRGALLVADRLYMQVLEGPAAAVDRLMDNICRDSRHACIVWWLVEDVDGRTPMFSDWTMAFSRVGPVEARPADGLEMMAHASLHAILAAHPDRAASRVVRGFLEANEQATWPRPR